MRLFQAWGQTLSPSKTVVGALALAMAGNRKYYPAITYDQAVRFKKTFNCLYDLY